MKLTTRIFRTDQGSFDQVWLEETCLTKSAGGSTRYIPRHLHLRMSNDESRGSIDHRFYEFTNQGIDHFGRSENCTGHLHLLAQIL